MDNKFPICLEGDPKHFFSVFPNETNQILLFFFLNLLSCKFNSSQVTESSLPKYGLSEKIKLKRCLAKLVLCVAFLRCLTVQPLMAL